LPDVWQNFRIFPEKSGGDDSSQGYRLWTRTKQLQPTASGMKTFTDSGNAGVSDSGNSMVNQQPTNTRGFENEE
jgi:hypothetical protein